MPVTSSGAASTGNSGGASMIAFAVAVGDAGKS
jgi:hypothetical protein